MTVLILEEENVFTNEVATIGLSRKEIKLFEKSLEALLEVTYSQDADKEFTIQLLNRISQAVKMLPGEKQ